MNHVSTMDEVGGCCVCSGWKWVSTLVSKSLYAWVGGHVAERQSPSSHTGYNTVTPGLGA